MRSGPLQNSRISRYMQTNCSHSQAPPVLVSARSDTSRVSSTKSSRPRSGHATTNAADFGSRHVQIPVCTAALARKLASDETFDKARVYISELACTLLSTHARLPDCLPAPAHLHVHHATRGSAGVEICLQNSLWSGG